MSDQEKPEAAAAKKGRRGKLFIIIGVVVLLAGGGGAAYWMMRRPAAPEKAEAPKHHSEDDAIVTFEPFVANLADEGGQRFLRISVRLIVDGKENAEHVQESEVTLTRLRSAILDLLTQQTADRLVTPDGKTALKKAIAEHVATIVEPTKVSDVLFSDLVVQF